MALPYDGVDRRHEFPPRGPLLGEHPPPLGGETVEAAAPLARPFHPPPADVAPVFEPAQHRIQRGDPKTQPAARALGDPLADVVAVPRSGLEQRQDQQLGASLFQLAAEHAIPPPTDRHTIYRFAAYTAGSVRVSSPCRASSAPGVPRAR